MRVCLIVRALPLHRLGGLEFHTHDLANELAATGHEVTVLTSRAPAGRGIPGPAANYDVVHLDEGRPGDYTLPYFRRCEAALHRLENSRAFDVVHAQEFSGLFLRPSRAPFVVTVHGTMYTEVPLDRRYWRRLSWRARLRAAWQYKTRLALHPAFRRMLPRVDRIIVDSEFTRCELLLMTPALDAAIHVVPPGVDPSRYGGTQAAKARQPGEPLRIALLGRVQEMKGLGVAVVAAGILASRGVSFQMRIGGSGPYTLELQRRITAMGLAGRVRLDGPVAHDAVPQFLAGADVFLFPDKTQPAFGLVAVEAMMCGLPVIGARSGAIPETVNEDTGWLYDAWSPADLARAIEWIDNHPAELEAKALRSRKRGESFTARRMAEETTAVYEAAGASGVMRGE